MLDEACTAELLARTHLRSVYVEADLPATDTAMCGACGVALDVMHGARRMVCEHCGGKVDVESERVRCAECGADLAPTDEASSFACPRCQAVVHRVARPNE